MIKYFQLFLNEPQKQTSDSADLAAAAAEIHKQKVEDMDKDQNVELI